MMDVQKNSYPITSCQICSSDQLESIVFLGYVPPVNSMPTLGSPLEEQSFFPLELVHCKNCSLVQIGHQVSPQVLFPYSYPYLSGTTRVLRDNFAELETEASRLVGLDQGDLVIDIGSNDGTLLSNFTRSGYRVLGIEPSQAGDVARKNGIETITSYFGLEAAHQLREDYGFAKLVTAANVFAHIGNVHDIVRGILHLLPEDGVFVSESHYLGDLIETLQYDTIYHEHLRYYSLSSLEKLFAEHGLEVFHVTRIPTHGGSIRVYAAKVGTRSVDNTVAELREIETRNGIADGTALYAFKERVLKSKQELLHLLADLKLNDKRIVGIGAPSRASTLVSFVGLDESVLDAILEVSGSHKLDKYMPGTRIPIVDEKLLYDQQPDYALFLSWHIADELAVNLRKRGYRGNFILPLPTPKLIELGD